MRRVFGILGWVLVWAGLTLLFAAIGIRVFFGRISVDALVLNLMAIDADGGGGGGMVWLAVLVVGVLPVALTLLLARWRARRARRLAASIDRPDGRERAAAARTRAARIVAGVTAGLVVAGGTTAFADAVSLDAYIAAESIDMDVAEYYVEPTVVDDSKARNLVVVYVESAEDTLSDPEVFAPDMLEPIMERTADWARIDDYQQYTDGGWTMAGLVSTQCGVPLKGKMVASGASIVEDVVEGIDSYLTGATCLGDVLAEHGYTNVFMGGANPSFAGKNVFLEGHGYEKELGLEDWREAGESENDIRPDWGLSDERLMAHAREQVTALHDEYERTGTPFNLTMLTVDTHEPAHLYDTCDARPDAEGDELMAAIWRCSTTAVAGFVEYLDEQGYLDDTAVVVMGDHLKQAGATTAFRDALDAAPVRTIFNRIWIPGGAPSTPRAGADQLSMFATLLDAAGLELEDDRAGLGVSVFADEIPPKSALSLEPSKYNELLRSRSADFYARMWNLER